MHPMILERKVFVFCLSWGLHKRSLLLMFMNQLKVSVFNMKKENQIVNTRKKHDFFCHIFQPYTGRSRAPLLCVSWCDGHCPAWWSVGLRWSAWWSVGLRLSLLSSLWGGAVVRVCSDALCVRETHHTYSTGHSWTLPSVKSMLVRNGVFPK